MMNNKHKFVDRLTVLVGKYLIDELPDEAPTEKYLMMSRFKINDYLDHLIWSMEEYDCNIEPIVNKQDVVDETLRRR